MRRWFIGLLAGLLLAPAAWAAELRVMISGGLQAPFETLAPVFEQASGHRVLVVRGPSMGETPQAIPNRIARGEPVDVVIMVGDALGALISAGRVEPGSRVDVANSKIALAVKAGDAKPDISSVEALKAALLQARSVAWSDSASGVYIQNTLLPRLGIAEALKGKGRMIPAEPVARVVARGEAQLGFQQLSELKAVPGIDIVGLLPEGAQKVTVFSAGIASAAQQPQAGRDLIAFLMSERARGVIAEAGLEPLAPAR